MNFHNILEFIKSSIQKAVDNFHRVSLGLTHYTFALRCKI
jgi:hypothetical protein